MEKIFLVWERECFDNYDVVYVTQSKEEAIIFVEKLTGKKYDPQGNNDYYKKTVSYTSIEVYIEERELNKYDELSV